MKNIETFLLNYAHAYLDFDPISLVPFFYLPCVIVDQEGTHSLADSEAVIEYEAPFLGVLEKAEVDEISVQLLDLHPKSYNLNFATVNYWLKSNRTTIGDFDYHYGLIQPEGEIKIAFAHYSDVRLWNP